MEAENAKPEGVAATPTPAEAEKPAAKPVAAKPPAAKAAVKPATPKEPLKDNGDGTVTDPNTGLMWKKKDAWLEKKRFFKWDEHKTYIAELVTKKFAGFADWRLPTKEEAASLVDKTKGLVDKNGTVVPIDPVFEAGCFASTWIQECSDAQIVRYDLKIGLDTPYPGKDIWSSIWVCRKAAGAPAPADKPAVAKAAVPAGATKPIVKPAGAAVAHKAAGPSPEASPSAQ
jgi:hypothetical protein